MFASFIHVSVVFWDNHLIVKIKLFRGAYTNFYLQCFLWKLHFYLRQKVPNSSYFLKISTLVGRSQKN